MMHRTRGFTLIELLVAISILAIVAVLGWRGLDGIVRARVALTENMETTRGMQLAFAQMQSDCEHMVTTVEIQGRPNLASDAAGMTLVRNSHNENAPSQLQVISYRIVDGVLMRRESPGTRDLVQLDMFWQAANSNADTTPPVLLQSGVLSMQVETWENNAWRMAGAPQPQGTALPASGLRVALQVQGQQIPMSKAFLLGGM
ncbi:prepilin-type N-terminal cleavage/methylation domain-containing protein [Massilia sp. RP-1-19]|uniref:Prepilin-type N-terminal cleavage/methylation domain-containing protein n=1 Tax=Massilia polaris TaxID=2728846 RepID=A0A848HJF8_9BURK|nr:prepilin-type N-terminal cleavage/methylation domain-containing protein [Massilia polaris]NML60269.1 prepilin-type N-terminal cleavage/methylation domain-containing protein [Massilia polaris]